MPFPNEHAARIKRPAQFDRFRRTAGGKLVGLAPKITAPKSVGVIWGHLTGRGPDAWAIASLRFAKKSWTDVAARKWLKDNKIKAAGFEKAVSAAGATSESESELDDVEILLIESDGWLEEMKEPRFTGPDDKRLPDHVRKIEDERLRSIWAGAYNAGFDHCQSQGGTDCVAHATKLADARLKKLAAESKEDEDKRPERPWIRVPVAASDGEDSKEFRERQTVAWVNAHKLARSIVGAGDCQQCKAKDADNVHHKNGNWEDNRRANLERLCKACHTDRHTKHAGDTDDTITMVEGDPKELEMEIFRAGDYTALGKGKFTAGDVRAMAKDYSPEFHEAPVTRDHIKGGQAYGWIKSLRAAGDTLVATIHKMTPEFIEGIKEHTFTKRSVEIWKDFLATGRPHIRAVTMLGAAIPAVKGMKDVALSESDEANGEYETYEFESVEVGGLGDDVPANQVGRSDVPTKTESSMDFPRWAYAYAADPQNSETWDVRIWETPDKRVTREQLGRATAAISPGGLAGVRADIPKDQIALVRGRLRAEYAKLNVAYADMPHWVKESDGMKPELCREVVALAESEGGEGRVWPVQIIKAGFNKSGSKYYPWETLKRDGPKVFDGVKMAADHESEDSVKRSWVGVLKDVVADDATETLRGRAHIIENWFGEKLTNLKAADAIDQMRVSILAKGSGTRTKVDGRACHYIDSIDRARRVDFVTADGAGGCVLREDDTADPWDVDFINAEELAERRPDLVSDIQADALEKMQMEVTTMTEELKTAEEERDALKVKLEEKDTKIAELTETAEKDRQDKAKAETLAAVTAALAKVELPEWAAQRVTEKFADAESADGLDDEIARWKKDLVATDVKGLGDGDATDHSEDDAKKSQERLETTFYETFIREGDSEELARSKAQRAAAG